jgi:CTP synthase
MAVVEYARNVMNLPDANSTEFDPSAKTPCVIFMPEVIILWSCAQFLLW